jgi:hypothetical protein
VDVVGEPAEVAEIKEETTASMLQTAELTVLCVGSVFAVLW